MKVLPNPYSQLDAKGGLAGAHPMPERTRPTHVLPVRSFVGATREMVELLRKGPNASDDRSSRAEYRFTFSADPVDLAMKAPHERVCIVKAIRNRSLVKADNLNEAIAVLAEERAKAVRKYERDHGKKCCPKTWLEQFPLDKEVAEASKELLAKYAAADEARKKAVEAEVAKLEAEEAEKAKAAEKARIEAEAKAEKAKRDAAKANKNVEEG